MTLVTMDTIMRIINVNPYVVMESKPSTKNAMMEICYQVMVVQNTVKLRMISFVKQHIINYQIVSFTNNLI